MITRTTTAAVPADEGRVEPPVTGWGSGYRPYLDGLRAVAVYLVVLFHAGWARFGGGYVGVDVFFVLSGFLVTRLLMRDLEASGSVRLGRFYARRFRRLLPAAFATLVITALVFAAIASPVEVLDAAGGFKAAFLYVTNWYFIAQSANYFGADLASNPVLHFWSLAVEEQFYLLWPLLLGGLFVVTARFGSRRTTVLRATVAAGALGSLAWAWWLKDTNPNRAYYGTDARAYQLLAGALLALTPTLIARFARHPKAARWTGPAALAALVAVATTWSGLDAIERGALVTIVTVTLLAALEATNGGLARGVLSGDAIVYLGKISYGTYLWHWPVIVVLTRTFDPATGPTVALTILIATALASLSYQLLEHPIRVSSILDRHRRTVIAVGLATSVIAAIIIIPAITNPATSTAAVAGQDLTTTGFTPVPTGLDFQAIKRDYPALPNCYGKPATDCTLVHGTGPHILLIGDSHAGMLVPAFKALAEREHLTFSGSIHLACPWQRNLYALPLVAPAQRIKGCQQQKDDTYDRIIPQLKPDIVVLMNQSYEDPGYSGPYLGPDRTELPNGSPEYNSWLQQTTVDSVNQLRADGRKVVIVEPIPRAPDTMDTVDCLSKASVVEECRFVASTTPSTLEKLYRTIDDQHDNVWSLDIDRLVCPYLPICDPIIDHHVVRIDGAHLSATFSSAMEGHIAEAFRSNGILAG
jgi:peptidoglycan/LPS O-acetylase OafA/YrhL